ncbi:hypothetical protein OHU11_41630 (plasmid) [Streptomyces sp. NBC_00257]|uniref:hypothetical protein n=1 Tax=unclassified Streptomyces TaxID=2593676 RepID=UPI00224F4A43|nr:MULTISPECIES: hypothetical protein [unclassified Streptomyces]MCX5434682.1 hypothetical protein [Streptomyces sp. NBC_00062]WTD01060.1 hypothetical protein OH736_45840 [Streptomyces sp. NBC_01650]
MDVHRAVQLDDPELPALMVQCADECLAYKNQIKGRRDGVEVLFILAYLAVVFEGRSQSAAAMEAVYTEVYSTAMAFLEEFSIDSKNFLELQSLLDAQTGGGVNAPWPFLDVFACEVGPCFPGEL